MEDHEVAFYQGLARQHRGTSRQVGAWSEQSQTARFDVMFDVLDSLLAEGLAGLSVLDFGCGKGESGGVPGPARAPGQPTVHRD
jgi:hypothetical protein